MRASGMACMLQRRKRFDVSAGSLHAGATGAKVMAAPTASGAPAVPAADAPAAAAEGQAEKPPAAAMSKAAASAVAEAKLPAVTAANGDSKNERMQRRGSHLGFWLQRGLQGTSASGTQDHANGSGKPVATSSLPEQPLREPEIAPNPEQQPEDDTAAAAAAAAAAAEPAPGLHAEASALKHSSHGAADFRKRAELLQQLRAKRAALTALT